MTRTTWCLGALAVAVAFSGCFDFDALRKPLQETDFGVADLAANDLAPAHDLGGGDLASPAPPPAPVPRLIAEAWYSSASASTGMTQSAFSIPTAGIHDGDLVLFIANIDDGSNTLWPNPIAPGFTQLVQMEYGMDAQTYVVAYKFASSEPTTYSGTYGTGNNTGAAALALIAVSGARSVMPIDSWVDDFVAARGAQTSMNTINGSSRGIVTTARNCTLLLASGVDWYPVSGTNTFTLPPGFTSLSQLGDHGTSYSTPTWDWTSQQVSWATKTAAGPTGMVNWSAVGSQPGGPWTVLLAVAPAP